MSYRYQHHLNDPDPPLVHVVRNADATPRPDRVPLTQSPRGQRNVEPVGRLRRQSRRDREQQEKQRLKNRHGNYARYGDELDTPFEVDERSAAFMADHERFHGDVAGEERRAREVARKKHENTLLAMRRQAEKRDAEREARQQKYERREVEKYDARRADKSTPKASQGSTPYDPITLSSRDPAARKSMAEEEAHVRHMASLRMKRLQEANNRAGYDPITGARVRPVDIYPAPSRGGREGEH